MIALSFVLPDQTNYACVARSIVQNTLHNVEVADQDVDDILVIVGELCNNVIMHAHSRNKCFYVNIRVHLKTIHITVKDQGIGFDTTHIPPPVTEMLPEWIEHSELLFDAPCQTRYGGMGLPLVKSLSKKFDCCSDTNGTTVKTMLTRRREGDEKF